MSETTNILQQRPAGSSSRNWFSLTTVAVYFFVQYIPPLGTTLKKMVKFHATCFW